MKNIWIIVIVFLVVTCKVPNKYYVENVNNLDIEKCERFEKYIQKHWKKHEDGFFELKNYDKTIKQIYESAGLWREKYPNDPIQFGCTQGQSKEYIESLLGKPNQIIYYERFKINVWIYCLDWDCLTNKSYVGSSYGRRMSFEFDKNDKAIHLGLWY